MTDANAAEREAIAEAVAAEREACARLAEDVPPRECGCEDCRGNPRGAHLLPDAEVIADLIRARGAGA